MRLRGRWMRAGLIAGQFAMCAAVLGGPCGGKDGPTAPFAAAPTDDVTVTVTSYNPRVGETVFIGAQRVNAATKHPIVPTIPCVFASNPPAVAMINATTGAVSTVAPGTVTITVTCGNVNTTVTLTVRPAIVTLTITTLGTGTGSVFVTPAIGLGYEAGTTVTLTARPLSVQPDASVFAGWGGACAGAGTNPVCVLVLAANTVVTATFSPGFVLRILTAGTGSGGVSVAPSQQTYAAATPVQLTATAYDGSAFAGWTDDCAGTANPCNIVTNADRTVTAHFEKLVTLSTDFYGEFGRFSNYDGCTFEGTLSGSLAATHFTKVDGTLGGTATANVNIGVTTVIGSCTANSSSFKHTAELQGKPAALNWANTGPQAFSMVFNGTLTNPNRIDGNAQATRTFVATGASGTKQTVLQAQLPGMYLTP